jgi:hypothetical protein
MRVCMCVCVCVVQIRMPPVQTAVRYSNYPTRRRFDMTEPAEHVTFAM